MTHFSLSTSVVISPEWLKQESPDRLPPNGGGQGQMTRLLNFATIISFLLVKLHTSNFVCWLMHRSS